jgi:hypothetical protein
MYDVAKNIDSPDDQIEALEKLISWKISEFKTIFSSLSITQ